MKSKCKRIISANDDSDIDDKLKVDDRSEIRDVDSSSERSGETEERCKAPLFYIA